MKELSLTLGSRISTAGLNFLLILLCARWFGAEGVGQINLLKTQLALLVLIAGFSGTASLAYLASRYPLRYLYQASLAGTVLLSLMGAPLLHFYNPGLPEIFVLLLPILVLLLGTVQIQQSLLLGAGELGGHNLTGVLLAGSQLVMVALMVSGKNPETLTLEYAGALRYSYLITLLFSLLWLMKVWKTGESQNLTDTTLACYSYGFRAQLSNLVHFFNYRLTYYFLEHFTDTASVGIFSLGVSIAEALWLISQSIATVQYMKVARAGEMEALTLPTLRYAWLSLALAGLAVAALLIMPESIFVLIFSEQFRDSLPVLYWLLPGILAQSFSTQLAHYFAGRGMYGINLLGSVVGVGINLGAGLVLIPHSGIQGAAFTASGAYLAILIWQCLFFKKISGAGWKDFSPTTLLSRLR